MDLLLTETVLYYWDIIDLSIRLRESGRASAENNVFASTGEINDWIDKVKRATSGEDPKHPPQHSPTSTGNSRCASFVSSTINSLVGSSGASPVVTNLILTEPDDDLVYTSSDAEDRYRRQCNSGHQVERNMYSQCTGIRKKRSRPNEGDMQESQESQELNAPPSKRSKPAWQRVSYSSSQSLTHDEDLFRFR